MPCGNSSTGKFSPRTNLAQAGSTTTRRHRHRRFFGRGRHFAQKLRKMEAIAPDALWRRGNSLPMRTLKLLFAATLIGTAYIAWPLLTALQIRQAMLAGDTATLERKIEWEAVRTSLKQSLSAEAKARLETDPAAPPPSWWQRFKAYVAPTLADTAVDRYVTPQHLPSLVGYRQTYHNTVRPALGLKEPPTVLAGTWLGGTPIDRAASFYARVRRAVFYSLTRFEVEIVDRYRPERRYVGTFELKDFEWKLTALAILGDS